MNKPSSSLSESPPSPNGLYPLEARGWGSDLHSGSNGRQHSSGHLLCGLALVAGAVFFPALLRADSLWQSEGSKTMYADKRGTAIGDILTIVVQENTTASKDNTTKTSKQASTDASVSTFLYSPGASSFLTKGGQMPALKYGSKSDFTGGGTINNSEKLIGRIAVRVVDVLPNSNLVIEGSRDTAFSGEQQTIVLRGVVRSEDVAANNTVYSYNVADATIKFVSKGTITDAQRKGWFTKVWDKLSPF
jgi:flagellar L-ring protein FlgH